MNIVEATKRAFRDELAKIAGDVRSGAIPFSPETLAGKVRYTGAVRKTVRPRNLMKAVTASVKQNLLFGAGVTTGAVGAAGAIKARQRLDDERLARMRRGG